MSNVPLDGQRNEQPANDAGYAALMAVKPGERLKEARHKRKLDLEAAAEQLNLSVSVVRALEQDDYSALPSSTFIKGYIRSYARMMRLPADDLVRAFEYQTGVHSSMDEQHPIPDAPRKRSIKPLLLVVVLIAAVAVGLWWLLAAETETAVAPPSEINDEPTLSEPSTEPQVSNDPEPSPAEDAPVDDAPPADVRPQVETVPQMETDVEAPEEALAMVSVEPEVPQVSSDRVEQAPQVAPAEPAMALLTMRFSEDCWVEIRDPDGNLVHANLHRAGSLYEKSLAEPFDVKLGNGKAVKLSYNGAPVAIASSKRSNVANLSFGQ